jgi:hypothetical protein
MTLPAPASFCARPLSVVSPTAASAAFWECASSFRTRTLHMSRQHAWGLMAIWQKFRPSLVDFALPMRNKVVLCLKPFCAFYAVPLT